MNADEIAACAREVVRQIDLAHPQHVMNDSHSFTLAAIAGAFSTFATLIEGTQ